MAFLNAFLSYFVLFLVFVILVCVAVFIGISLRKRKNAKLDYNVDDTKDTIANE